jgi:ipoprotein LpqH
MTPPTGRRHEWKEVEVKRLLATAIGAIGCASALMACSSGGHAAGPASSVSTGGGGAQVLVGGSALAGLDPATVTCVKQGGKIDIGSGSTAGKQALAVVMTDEATPKVESLAMAVDGNALSVSNMGAKVGSANVSVDGKTYTITGQAQGADMKNPMAGMITKDFNIKVTCG